MINGAPFRAFDASMFVKAFGRLWVRIACAAVGSVIAERLKTMELWGGKVVGGRARGGEVAGRAVLFVPLEGIWELHDLPWDRPDDECDDSYWEDDQSTLDVSNRWDIDWVERSQIRDFIAEHFGDLNADDVAAKSV